MDMKIARRASSGTLTTAAVLACCLAAARSTRAQSPEAPPAAEQACAIDLRLPGMMKDIVSNVLLRSAHRPEAEVREFLEGAEKRYPTGDDLMRAAARHFKIDESKMAAEVERFRHVNCDHPQAGGDPGLLPGGGRAAAVELSPFARDVALHVILHELGHALIREFDLPILGNEETMADAFATHYLTTHLPDRALDVLRARTTSLMIEAGAVPRAQWPISGEHDNDGRRAFQIAALAVAADRARYDPVAKAAGMSADDVREARDYGAEIHRSWRRMLAPLMMPDGARSSEARVVCEPGSIGGGGAEGLIGELEATVARFDWHSQVTIRFTAGDGGASWSRNGRTITVHSEYLRRFIEQGRVAEFLEKGPVSSRVRGDAGPAQPCRFTMASTHTGT
jgi:hypothetical protein